MKFYDVIICGGGAAGFFSAINLAERNSNLKIAILERGKNVLEKVRISGGGRCNVMHSCFDPRELVHYYPRGEKELRGPFTMFGPTETQQWFEARGVLLKTEPDGRMFPTTDSSQTIISCFLRLSEQLGIDVLCSCSVQEIKNSGAWTLSTTQGNFQCDQLVIASGSSPKMWDLLQQLGHAIIPTVPSLFTFNIKDERIAELPGVSCLATVAVTGTKLTASGPLLITHWGMSGPAILKLSAWGARILAEKNYRFQIRVNWLHEKTTDQTLEMLQKMKADNSKKIISKSSGILPSRLWESLVSAAKIPHDKRWADISRVELNALAVELTAGSFTVDGKSTFKDEFVTAGGIDLKEVNFKTMESKLFQNLFFAGEVLNIDAITGGFNFQNAWTTGYLASMGITEKNVTTTD